jgi:putative endonuclease
MRSSSGYCTKLLAAGMTRPSTTVLGRAAEDRALAWLQKQGLVLVERNVRSRRGEIDLVMRDGDVLVFVEVRQRRSTSHGGAAASIGPAKQARLWHAAELYLMRQGCAKACRFDAVCIDGESLQWLKHILLRQT